ncbi:IclR family transcriptional regulator [Modestobacter marinus]|uniref:IclR family transcriptional regulator n=1 Tax=Modestobacter marinus TaxID=477641 RepID=A0ABQ2G6F4_9ACTN|nr:IclR family transcriptional regulator [Modestobacter marinus]
MPPYRVEAVDKALQLLLLLQRQDSVGVTEAAAHLGVARSTAHGLLATLRHRDFAVQSGDRRYRAGPALRRARPGGQHSPGLLAELAGPLVARLRDELDETVHLIVLAGSQAVFLISEEGRQPLRIGSRAGTRLPAQHTSGGKVLLAALPPEELARRFPDDELAEVEASLARVRRTWLGVNRGETEPGIGAVAVPVRDDAGTPIAALAVSLPLMRLTRQRLPELTDALHRSAAAISALAG